MNGCCWPTTTTTSARCSTPPCGTTAKEALTLAPLAALEVAAGPLDDHALRGGAVELAARVGLAVLAHAPLGGARKVARLARDPALAAIAAARGCSPVQVALAWLLGLHPAIVALPGPSSPAHATDVAAAAGLVLAADERAALDARFPHGALVRARPRPAPTVEGEVVLVVGVAGAGKTSTAAAWTARGYHRLNRDERGGTMRGLHRELGLLLAAGQRRVVLDNTYLTRALRRDVLEIVERHGVAARAVWIDTPVVEAQRNVVDRMLATQGRLLEPAELRNAKAPGIFAPGTLTTMTRTFEPPALDEGFAAVDVVRFARRPSGGVPATLIALDALASGEEGPHAAEGRGPPGRDRMIAALANAVAAAGPGPCLVFGWRPDAEADAAARLADALTAATGRAVAVALCRHPAGPPICWCRPPLPGLALAFAAAARVDLAASVVVGHSVAHRSVAVAIGAQFVDSAGAP